MFAIFKSRRQDIIEQLAEPSYDVNSNRIVWLRSQLVAYNDILDIDFEE